MSPDDPSNPGYDTPENMAFDAMIVSALRSDPKRTELTAGDRKAIDRMLGEDFIQKILKEMSNE